MPSMAGDGLSPINLAVENKSNVDQSSITGKQKRMVIVKKQQKPKPKVDSDLKIVAELSGDSDGQKFHKTLPNKLKTSVDTDSETKTSVESSEDDLGSDLEKRRLGPFVLMSNIPEKKRIESVANKMKNVAKKEKRGQGPPEGKLYSR